MKFLKYQCGIGLLWLIACAFSTSVQGSGVANYDAAKHDVESAYRMCLAFDSTGLLSEPCKVSGWSSTINVTMDTSSAEARKMCQGIPAIMNASNVRFRHTWTLRIYSPYSGERTLAQCAL